MLNESSRPTHLTYGSPGATGWGRGASSVHQSSCYSFSDYLLSVREDHRASALLCRFSSPSADYGHTGWSPNPAEELQQTSSGGTLSDTPLNPSH